MAINKAYTDLSNIIKGKLLIKEQLSKYTTFKIGGPADLLIVPRDVFDLRNILLYTQKNKIDRFIIGTGSNTLVKDDGFKGVVIKLNSSEFKQIRLENSAIVVGAGITISKLLSFCIDHNKGGLEFLAGIPGTVGGIVSMNSGAWNKSVSDVIKELKIMDKKGNILILKRKQMRFNYRNFKPSNVVIIEATFRVVRRKGQLVSKEINRLIVSKKLTQDLKFPSAGCIFKNPARRKLTSALMIEKSGLKGTRFGGAEVSKHHANFIVNRGRARASDVISLINIIRDKIKMDHNVNLRSELIIV